MNDAEYTIKNLRSCGAGNMPWTVFPREARCVVEHIDHLAAENERLQKENAYLKACVSPTKPGDYGHEAWTEALREAVAAERRSVVAFLRDQGAAMQAAGLNQMGRAFRDAATHIANSGHLEAE